MDRQKWLEGLKVGDKVIVDQYRYGKSTLSVATISAITFKRKKKFFEIANSKMLFSEGGQEISDKGSFSIKASLEPLTAERKATIERGRLERKITSLTSKEGWSNHIELEDLREVFDTIRSEDG